MSKAIAILVPALLLAQFTLVHWAEGTEMRPAPPNPASFPASFAGWRQFIVDPSSAEQAASIKAGAVLTWTYFRTAGASNANANLFVAWFASQRGGDAFVHRPEVCLPGNGWIIQSRSTTTIDAAGGSISATRDVVAKGEDRQVVLYWYQTPRRAAANLWELKMGLAADVLSARRSDVALVRVVTPIDARGDESATKVAAEFARDAFPVLRGWLPH